MGGRPKREDDTESETHDSALPGPGQPSVSVGRGSLYTLVLQPSFVRTEWSEMFAYSRKEKEHILDVFRFQLVEVNSYSFYF